MKPWLPRYEVGLLTTNTSVIICSNWPLDISCDLGCFKVDAVPRLCSVFCDHWILPLEFGVSGLSSGNEMDILANMYFATWAGDLTRLPSQWVFCLWWVWSRTLFCWLVSGCCVCIWHKGYMLYDILYCFCCWWIWAWLQCWCPRNEQALTRRMVLTCQNSEARFDSSLVFSLSLSLSLVC